MRFPSVRYFYGEEWLVRKHIEEEIDRLLPQGFRELHLEVFLARDLTAEAFWRSVQAVPLLAPSRIVWIQGAERITGALMEAVLAYVESPEPQTVLILSGERPDLRHRLFQLLRRKKWLVELAALKRGETIDWLQKEARRSAKELSREAAQSLVDEVGADLRTLYSELQKLILFVGEKRRIDIGDVEAVVASVPTKSIFALVDAMVSQDRARSFGASEEVLAQGVHPLQVLSLLERQFRLLSRLKELQASAVPRSRWSAELRVPPFIVSKMEDQGRRLHPDFLDRALSFCFEADLQMKTSRLPVKFALEHLILQLTGLGLSSEGT